MDTCLNAQCYIYIIMFFTLQRQFLSKTGSFYVMWRQSSHVCREITRCCLLIRRVNEPTYSYTSVLLKLWRLRACSVSLWRFSLFHEDGIFMNFQKTGKHESKNRLVILIQNKGKRSRFYFLLEITVKRICKYYPKI